METRNLAAIAVFITVLLAGTSDVAAATLYVSQTSTNPMPPYATWDTAAHTIQEAVDAASDGDTVLVAAGEYRLTNQVTITKGILLRSDSGRDQTILNGQEKVRCLWVSNSVAVVDGFMMWRGEGPDGAGIFLVGGTVQNCRILSCFPWRAGPDGASARVIGGVLSNSIVSDAFLGGRLVHCSDGGLVTDCQIVAGGLGRGRGTGVYLTDSQLGNSVISGMQFHGVHAISSTIFGCTITSNWLQGAAGGGAYLDGCEVDQCVIVGNIAGFPFGPAGRGGGVFATNSVIRNSLIAGNIASAGDDHEAGSIGGLPGFGGGIYLIGGSLLNCTVTENAARNGSSGLPANGGGIYVESEEDGTGNPIIRNSIIYFNSASSGANWYWDDPLLALRPLIGPGSFDHCCTTPDPSAVGNNVIADASHGRAQWQLQRPDLSPIGNNVVADPQFVDPANGDYRLGPNSPCIDAGLNEEWMDGAQDLDGNPRIQNGRVDIGAYESTGAFVP
jgi:hypothetical protein